MTVRERFARRPAASGRWLALGTGAVLSSVVAITGLPVRPAPPRAGQLASEIITLSGPDAEATPPAGAAPGAAMRTPPAAASSGWSAAIDVDDGTLAVAASWVGSEHGTVEVRGRSGSSWTGWVPLAAEPDEAPDDARRSSGGMAWFGAPGVDDVEVRVVEGSLRDLEVQAMQYDPPTGWGTITGLIPGAGVAGATASQPAIQPRSSWTSSGWASSNSGCSSGPVTASGGVRFAVVHHTVNANTYAASDVPAMLAAIRAYHTGTNGWCDIAYNFVIDRFGRIWEGRAGGVALPIVGGHAQGFNTGSVGIAFLGQHEPGASPAAAAPSSAARESAARLIAWKLGLHHIDPQGQVTVTSGGSNGWPSGSPVTIERVTGHRALGFTSCPGTLLYDVLPAIRTRAHTLQGGAPPPPPPSGPWAPFATAADLVTRQYRDVLKRDPTAADLAYWTSRVGASWSPGRFVAQLQASSEADRRVHAVTRLYRAYFLRIPDHGGLTYWLQRRGQGVTLASISASFATSSEFRNRYGGLTDDQFVTLVYANVLGRQPDGAGRAHWVGQLAQGLSRGQLMANFSQSSEHVRTSASSVRVVATYEDLLRRAPTQGVHDLAVAGLETHQLSLTTLSTNVFQSAEYRSQF
jgi:hypothetical protein